MQPFKQRKLHQIVLGLTLSYITQSCSQGNSMDFSPRKQLQKKFSRHRSSFRKGEKIEVDYAKQHQHNYQAHYILLKAITEVLVSNCKVSDIYEEVNRHEWYSLIDPHTYYDIPLDGTPLDPTLSWMNRWDSNMSSVLLKLFKNRYEEQDCIAGYATQTAQQIKDSLLIQINQTADAKQKLQDALKQAQEQMAFVDVHSVNYAADKINYEMSVTLAGAVIDAIDSNLYRAKAHGMYHMINWLKRMFYASRMLDPAHVKDNFSSKVNLVLGFIHDCNMPLKYQGELEDVIDLLPCAEDRKDKTVQDRKMNDASQALACLASKVDHMRSEIDQAYTCIMPAIHTMNKCLVGSFALDQTSSYPKIQTYSEQIRNALTSIVGSIGDTTYMQLPKSNPGDGEKHQNVRKPSRMYHTIAHRLKKFLITQCISISVQE